MTLIYTFINYLMIVGVALDLIVFIPYPRFLRRPIVHGLEAIVTFKWIKQLEMIFLSIVAVVWVNSLLSMKDHQNQYIGHKAQRQAAIEGVSVVELDRTINQTKMLMFYDQRNVYLSFFVLMLYYILFTYLFSLKRYDHQHEEFINLEKKDKVKDSAVRSAAPQEAKDKKD